MKSFKTWDDLLALVSGGATEGSDVDFKLAAYWDLRKPAEKREQDKEELRRDATAFANNGGGVLVIGVEEGAQGHVVAIPGIERPSEQENQIREVLSRLIEPPLTSVQVRTILDPTNTALGVVVVDIGGAELGLPHAVQSRSDVPLDFWLRVDKSKRRMTYLQLRAFFRSESEGGTQQGVDAAAISEIHKLGHEISIARENRAKTLKLLEKLRFYTVERGYGMGVRLAVMSAAKEAVVYPRYGIFPAVAEAVADTIKAALPMFFLRSSIGRTPSRTEMDLLLEVSAAGWDLAYDGVKYLAALPIIAIGSELLGRVLRLAHLNEIKDFKERLLDDLDRLREMAVATRQHDAVKILDYQREQAFEERDGPFVEIPDGLDWAILGHEGPGREATTRFFEMPKRAEARQKRPRSK